MKKYPGKNALWFLLFVIIYTLIPPCVYFFWEGGAALSPTRWAIFFLCFYAVDLIWLSYLLRNRVELSEDKLVVYSGLNKTAFPLSSVLRVERVEKTALSPERLRVTAQGRKFYLAVKDLDGLAAELNQAAARNKAERG